jgi:hypothetical protein
MAQVLKKTRLEVEAGLKQRSSSIASRLEAIESALPVPSKRIRSLASKRTLVRIGAAVAVGAVAGIFILRYHRDPARNFTREFENVRSSIGQEIKKNLNKGLDTEDAVSRALDKRPPILNLGGASGTFWSGMLSQLSHHVTSALGPVIAEKIADRIRGSSDEK